MRRFSTPSRSDFSSACVLLEHALYVYLLGVRRRVTLRETARRHRLGLDATRALGRETHVELQPRTRPARVRERTTRNAAPLLREASQKRAAAEVRVDRATQLSRHVPNTRPRERGDDLRSVPLRPTLPVRCVRRRWLRPVYETAHDSEHRSTKPPKKSVAAGWR
jgi:hypothetical protein